MPVRRTRQEFMRQEHARTRDDGRAPGGGRMRRTRTARAVAVALAVVFLATFATIGTNAGAAAPTTVTVAFSASLRRSTRRPIGTSSRRGSTRTSATASCGATARPARSSRGSPSAGSASTTRLALLPAQGREVYRRGTVRRHRREVHDRPDPRGSEDAREPAVDIYQIDPGRGSAHARGRNGGSGTGDAQQDVRYRLSGDPAGLHAAGRRAGVRAASDRHGPV